MAFLVLLNFLVIKKLIVKLIDIKFRNLEKVPDFEFIFGFI